MVYSAALDSYGESSLTQGHLELRALASQRYNSAVVPRWCMVQTTTQQGFLSSHSQARLL